jgi:hypothetical protein
MACFNQYGEALNSLIICAAEFNFNDGTLEGIVKYYKIDLSITDSFDKLLFLVCSCDILHFDDFKSMPSIVMNYFIQKYPDACKLCTLTITDDQNFYTQISKLHNYNYFYNINYLGPRDITKGIQKIKEALITSVNLLSKAAISL